MGNFELVVRVLHIALLDPHTTPLLNYQNGCDTRTTTGWNNYQFNTKLEIAGSLPCQHNLLLQELTIMASIV